MPRSLVRGFGIMVIGAIGFVAGMQEVSSTDGFAVYQSDNVQLRVQFEYPSGWQAEYSQGGAEAYAQAQVYGPPTLEARLRVYLVVRAVPPLTRGGRYDSVEAMAADYRRTLLPTLRVEGESAAVVLDAPARRLDVSGTMRLPWEALDAADVPVKGQRVFFEKHGRFYELAWLATPEVSPAVQAAFNHLLDTLTIQE